MMMLNSQPQTDALKVAHHSPVLHRQVREHRPALKGVDKVQQHDEVAEAEEEGEEAAGDNEALHCHQNEGQKGKGEQLVQTSVDTCHRLQ